MLPSAECKGFSASPAGECKALVREDCLHQCTHILLDKTHNYSMLHAPYRGIEVLPQATASRLLYLTKFLICIEPEITRAVLEPLYFTVTSFPPSIPLPHNLRPHVVRTPRHLCPSLHHLWRHPGLLRGQQLIQPIRLCHSKYPVKLVRVTNPTATHARVRGQRGTKANGKYEMICIPRGGPAPQGTSTDIRPSNRSTTVRASTLHRTPLPHPAQSRRDRASSRSGSWQLVWLKHCGYVADSPAVVWGSVDHPFS